MKPLQIPYSVARQIADHAQADRPNEVCGLLAGRGNQILEAIPVQNIAEQPKTRYQMEPTEQIRALKQIEKDDLEWLGIYHSHPNSAPIPSPTDISKSTDSSLIHMIVSLKSRKPALKAWQIDETSITPIDLIFHTQSPNQDAHEPLSNSQKVAIILTSIICVILLLVISFTLLPPAPEITPIP